jgi:hypothetical protein
MSEKMEDGGPAFPQISKGQGYPDYETGLSIRDWFAGQIAAGMASHSGTQGLSFGPGSIAERAYEVADAMLAARAAKET